MRIKGMRKTFQVLGFLLMPVMFNAGKETKEQGKPTVWFNGIKIIEKSFIVMKLTKNNARMPETTTPQSQAYWKFKGESTNSDRNATLTKMTELGKALRAKLRKMMKTKDKEERRKHPRTYSTKTLRLYFQNFQNKNCDEIFNYSMNHKRRRKRKYIPTNRRNILLYCKTGYLLQILEDGSVTGTTDADSKYAALELQVISSRVKRIMSTMTGKYLAINRKGQLVSRAKPTRDTYFQEEMLENYYHTFSSCAYSNARAILRWFVGIRHNGHPKRASRAAIGDPSTQFQYIYT